MALTTYFSCQFPATWVLCILLDAELRGAEKKLVAAHEIAHILFGHCKQPSPYQEEEARIFAAVVVAMDLFRAYEQGQPLGPQGGGFEPGHF